MAQSSTTPPQIPPPRIFNSGSGSNKRVSKFPHCFNVTARNPNQLIWIFYKALRGSVYYKDHRVAVEPVLHSHYYQKPKNTTVLENVFSGTMTASTVDNQRWLEFKSDRVKETVMFSLKFISDVKYRKTVGYN
ncbi:hypothetical protein Dsin_027850 [Dipteronia sinensis]|uniref:Late embryogenesis abundant protein LEA-2 subgroup domain-containing protein n=1 Tax=Dipteronia sinensis TaxID=43782 RepID=A0AAE0DU04_9ROSI|nr:hypothetical protein Dsin_027850 [Dipteronia sinensis]